MNRPSVFFCTRRASLRDRGSYLPTPMRLSHRHFILVALPLACVSVLAAALIWRSYREYRSFQNFEIVSRLLVSNTAFLSSLTNEKYMVWGTVTGKGKNAPEVQEQNFRDAAQASEKYLDEINGLVERLDLSLHSDGFLEGLKLYGEMGTPLANLRAAILDKSADINEAQALYTNYVQSINDLFKGLCKETEHAELARKTVVQNDIIALEANLMEMRGALAFVLRSDRNTSDRHFAIVKGLDAVREKLTTVKQRSNATLKERIEEFESNPDMVAYLAAASFVDAKGYRDSGEGHYKYDEIDALNTAISNVRGLIEELVVFVNNDILALSERVLHEARASLRNVVIFCILSFASCIVLCAITGRRINRSIESVCDNLHASSVAGTESAQSINMSTNALADGASRQAASLEEICASLEELASMTQSNLQSVAQSSSVSKDANKSVTEISEEVARLRSSMDDIERSSKEVSGIIKIIEDIAFQTNILALNAAVEAARAGAAGAGFAVVADEVRNLASRSAEAASEISSKLTDSVNKSKQGNNISKNVEGRLGKILTESSELSKLLEQINDASCQQNETIQYINTALSDLDTLTQNSAAQAEETASAVSEMRSQSIVIVDNVGVLEAMVRAKKTEKRTFASPAAVAKRRSSSIPSKTARPLAHATVSGSDDCWNTIDHRR